MRTMHARRRLVTLLVVVLAGCSSTPASPSSGATPTPSPAGSTAPATPLASAEAWQPGAVVVTVSDGLRVRSEPRVSDDSIMYDPLLPLGTELVVLDGPVSGSGYAWYKISPVSFAALSGPGSGWVASAGKDGEKWIAAATGPTADLAVAMAAAPRAAADPADAKRAAASINAFGVDVLRGLLADSALDLRNKNAVFSPTSIEIALAMARAGARGETASEMDKVLHSAGWDELSAGLNALDQALSSRDATWTDYEGAPEHQLTLRMANAPFAQRGWAIEPSYLEAMASAFGAGLRLVDYIGDVDAARATINKWVSDRTAGRIPELLSPAQLSVHSRLTLVNAIYMKAEWATPFLEDLTKPAAFTRLDGSRVTVPMMMRRGGQGLPYVRGDGWQATELRYLGPLLCENRLPCQPDSQGPRLASPPLAMLLVLPDDLLTFEAGLTAQKLGTITAAVTAEQEPLLEYVDCPGAPRGQRGCYSYSLDLFMPRFSIGTRAEMNEMLEALGMPLAFDVARADFSGITAQERLHIAFVVHQANIDVDEKGTEAAAATAVGVDVGGPGYRPLKEITMRLDKPFLFFLRDVETGAILFMGRVTDPSVPREN